MIGITWSGYQKVNPLKTLEYSFREVGLQVKITLKSVKMLVSQKLGVKDLSGPVGIVSIFDNGKLDHFDQCKSGCYESFAITSIGWWTFIIFDH